MAAVVLAGDESLQCAAQVFDTAAVDGLGESQRVFGAGEAGGRDIRGRVHGGIVGQGDFALAGAVVSQPSRAQRQPI
jgi:hypothetical protein